MAACDQDDRCSARPSGSFPHSLGTQASGHEDLPKTCHFLPQSRSSSDSLGRRIVSRSRSAGMTTCRAQISFVTALGAAYCVLSWVPPAHAQVKLEYKLPEGKTLKYQSTSRARQVLTFMGDWSSKREERDQGPLAHRRQPPARRQARPGRKGRVAAGGVLAPRRHPHVLDSSKPDSKTETTSSLSWATSSSWRAKSPIRSSSTSRTR